MQDRAVIFRETSLLHLKKEFGVFITFSKAQQFLQAETLLSAGIKVTATASLHVQNHTKLTNST